MQSHESGDDVVYLQLHPGDRVLESIEETIDAHDIQTGVIVSGIGSLSNLHVHYVTSYPQFPESPDDLQETDEFLDDEGGMGGRRITGRDC